MAYIPSHQTLRDHPKLKRLARRLGISEVCAIGHLHLFWWWALDYAPNGSLHGRDSLDIAIGANWEGDESQFVDALQECGFVDDLGGNLALHDWGDYGGRYQEKLEKDRDRKRTARDAQRKSADVPVESEGSPPDSHGIPKDGATRREEKRRETLTPLPPSGDAIEVENSFAEFWSQYPKGRGSKPESLKLWRKLSVADRHAAISAIPLFKAGHDWQRGFHSAQEVWLRNRRWEDPPEPSHPNGGVGGLQFTVAEELAYRKSNPLFQEIEP